jgi:hypothetical protein
MTKMAGRIAGIGLGALAAVGALSAVTGLRASEAQGGGLRGVWTAQPSRWKTTDGGINWEPITDNSVFGTGSVGAIGLSDSDPNTIRL